MKQIVIILMMTGLSAYLWAAGSAEEGGSNRTEYLATRGSIASAAQIIVPFDSELRALVQPAGRV